MIHGVSQQVAIPPCGPAVATRDSIIVPHVKSPIIGLSAMLVTGQVATNSVHSLHGPKHVVKGGKITVLTAEQIRELLDNIDITPLAAVHAPTRRKVIIQEVPLAVAKARRHPLHRDAAEASGECGEECRWPSMGTLRSWLYNKERAGFAALRCAESAPVQEPGERADGALARRQHAADDHRPESSPARLGRVFRSQPVGRAVIARRVGAAAAALPRMMQWKTTRAGRGWLSGNPLQSG